jgi:hypothetical protein
MRSLAYFIGSTAAFLITANIAFADNCSGGFANVGLSAETHEVEKGHSVTFFTVRASILSDNSPYNMVGSAAVIR